MKKSIAILFALLSFIFTTNSQTLNQSVFIDFGLNYSTNGIITASPDVNGNFWNNHTSVAVGAITILKNQAGTASGFTITNVTTFGANGGTAYGGLMAPTAALLGDFAIASATQDYFFLSTANTTYTLKISGLNVSKGYKFYVFGSRENATSRISKYVFTGSTSVTGTLPTSGSNLSGTGYNGNNSTIFTTSILTPNASGEVTFDLSIVSGGFAYINVMKIAEYTIDLNFDKVTSVTVSGADISTDGGNSQMTSVVLPEVAAVKEVTWTVSDPSIATINAFGLLTAKKNGTVNVTATSNEPACTINGSASIKITNQLVANQRVFVDFGPNDTINGNITLSPDINLNYWNNVTDGTITAPEVNLVNSSNNTTGFSLQITSPFSKNGILNGGLLAPNVNYLGEFAIPTVTQDYFFVEPAMTGSFKLKGLNKAKGYKISIFNSRTAVNPARISKFQITGTSLFEGILQSSGTNLGGPNINTNNSTIFTKSIIYPDDNGEILVTLTIESGSFAYINGMILEEYEAKLIAVDSLTVNGNDILIHEATSQMSVVFSPSNATIQPVVWSVDNESFASINFDGLLTPKRNGKVLVTASLTQNGVKITSSKQISVKNQISSLYISGT
ncbi:MAG: Ig-like domain-containing protein, partial [Paludibacter sp.]